MNDKLFIADSTQFNRSLGEGFHTAAESRAPKTDLRIRGQIFVRAFIGRIFLVFLIGRILRRKDSSNLVAHL